MENIKTSVIIPVYNVEKYIRECLESVFAQTQKEMEVIVVDDGSTDGSMEIVREYQEKYNSLRIISQRNQGLGAARNTGFRNARGKYVYYLDSDDCIKPDLLEACYECAESGKLEAVFFDAEPFWEERKNSDCQQKNSYDRRNVIRDRNRVYTGKDFFERYEPEGGYAVSACLMYVSREFLKHRNISFQEGILHEDIAYTFEIMLTVRRIKYLPQLFYYRRIRLGSITQDGSSEERIKGHFYAIGKMLRNIDDYTENEKYLDYAGKIFLTALYMGKSIKHITVETRDMAVICVKEIGERLLQKDTCSACRWAYKICNDMLKLFPEKRDELEPFFSILIEKRDKMLYSVLKEIPLNDSRKKIGIYGTGVHTNNFFAAYRRLMGEIKAEIYCFNTSVCDDGAVYQGKKVYNIQKLGQFPIDLLVISSVKYEDDMYQKIESLYGDKYPIVRFYERDKCNLFP